MPQSSVATQVHEALDIDRNLAAQVPLYAILAIDQFTDTQNLVITQLIDAAVVSDFESLADFCGFRRTNSVDIS